VIIMLNGSFASGKSTVAELLVKRLYHSMLYDPEMVGYGLRPIIQPVETVSDFQDLTIWRPLVVETARQLKRVYGRTLVVPMTLWHRPYFEEIVAGLREIDPHLYHFCLTASRETLLQRLARREHTDEAHAWIQERIEYCVPAFESPAFRTHIPTDAQTPEEIVETILALIDADC
jgi:hypothetical protein